MKYATFLIVFGIISSVIMWVTWPAIQLFLIFITKGIR